MTNQFPVWLELFADNELVAKSYLLACSFSNYQENKIKALINILVDLKADQEMISAGLLLFAYQDGFLDKQSLIDKNVWQLLIAFDALKLIDRLHGQEKSDLESLRKMLLAMASDMRAVILKLAWQLLIIRQSDQFPLDQQQIIALQTRDLFAPLANRLGIAKVKSELEDRALQILEPDIYQALINDLEAKKTDHQLYVDQIIARLKKLLIAEGIEIRKLYGRVKHINSIYQKMKRKNLRFDQVNDIHAVRVEVATKDQCYQVLSVINNLWQPITEEFDDYIAVPKANGYQSLHTSVYTEINKMLEIQIRTTQMHEKAELGVAAHWAYKEKSIRHSRKFEQQIEWLRRVLDTMGDKSRGDMVFDQFKSEAFVDRVYAISPQGKVIDLPEGATALDFAYHIHTSLGHRCRGAKIDNKIVPLTRPLKNGETVEILTHKIPQPSRDWLNDHLGYVQTGRAKAKLRNYFRQKDKEKNKEQGQFMLEKECRRLDVAFSVDAVAQIAKSFNVNSAQDLYVKIGFGDIGVLQVIQALQEKSNTNQTIAQRIAKTPLKPIQKPEKSSKSRVEVDGFDDLLINFASCCQPVPPIEIVGFITQGRGINIHTKNCPNLQYLAKINPERIAAVNWNQQNNSIFSVQLKIQAYDRQGIFREINQVLSNERILINDINLINAKQQLIGTLTISITNLAQLSRAIDRLMQIKNMLSVRRI